ncbi:MAG: transporter substrate-binding domain-containing protein [Acidimicrobiia bacterium]|nr:transporter substrate-binding domain-containing protein [Acidimicrobiia bacterium]
MGAGARLLRMMRLLVMVAVVTTIVSLPFVAGAQTPSAEPATTAGDRPVLRVAVRPLQPFVVPEEGGRYSGFSVDLIRDIADDAGFDVQIVEVGSVGAQLDAVRQGRADLAIGAISVTSAREATVDFSAAMFQSGIQTMVAESSGNVTTSMILDDVFSPVLLTVFALMIIGTILIGVFVWAWERRHGNEAFADSGVRGAFDGIWWATVTLFTIGYGDKVPHRGVSRIVTMAWMFVGVLMVAVITAEVTSSLTVQRLESNISSVADLAGKDVISYPGTTSWDFLQKNGIDPRPVDSVDAAYDEVRSGDAEAFVYDASVIQWLAATRGGVKVAGPIMQAEDYGIAFPERSPWVEPVNRSLLRLRENGRYERLKKAYFD